MFGLHLAQVYETSRSQFWRNITCRFVVMSERPVIHQGDIIMEGALVKQSKHLMRWRNRWVVLTPQFLCSFKSQGDYTTPTECVRLKDCQCIKGAEQITGKKYSFTIMSLDRAFLFIASSAREKEKWLSAIGKQLVRPNMLIDDDSGD